jgi:hypothetical protein
MQLNSKQFKIAGKDFYAFLSNFAVNEFEESSGLSIKESGKNTATQMKLFFCCAKAGFKEAGKDFDLSLEQFMDLPYLETIEKFSEALYGKPQDEEKPKKK